MIRTTYLTIKENVFKFEVGETPHTLSYIHEGRLESTEVIEGLDVILKRQNPQNAGPLAEHFIWNGIAVQQDLEENRGSIPGVPSMIFGGDLGSRRGVGIISPKVGDKTLEEKLGEEGVLRIDTMLEVYLKLLDTIEALSKKDVVHCDITPDNIRVSDDLSQVFLIDFGIARKNGQQITTFYNGVPYVPECSVPSDKQGKYQTAGNLFMNKNYMPRDIDKNTIATSGIDAAMATAVFYQCLTGRRYDYDEGHLSIKVEEAGELPLKQALKDDLVDLLTTGFRHKDYKGVGQLREKALRIRKELEDAKVKKDLHYFYADREDRREHPEVSDEIDYDALLWTWEVSANRKNVAGAEQRAEQAFTTFRTKVEKYINVTDSQWKTFLNAHEKGGSADDTVQDLYDAYQKLEKAQGLITEDKKIDDDKKRKVLDNDLDNLGKKRYDCVTFLEFLEFETTYDPALDGLDTARRDASEKISEAWSISLIPDQLDVEKHPDWDYAPLESMIDTALEGLREIGVPAQTFGNKYNACERELSEQKKKIEEAGIQNAQLKAEIERRITDYEKRRGSIQIEYMVDDGSRKRIRSFIEAYKARNGGKDANNAFIITEHFSACLTNLKSYLTFEKTYAEKKGVLEAKCTEVAPKLQQAWGAAARIDIDAAKDGVPAKDMRQRLEGAVALFKTVENGLKEVGEIYHSLDEQIEEKKKEVEGNKQDWFDEVKARLDAYKKDIYKPTIPLQYLTTAHALKDVRETMKQKREAMEKEVAQYRFFEQKEQYDADIRGKMLDNTLEIRARELLTEGRKLVQEVGDGEEYQFKATTPANVVTTIVEGEIKRRTRIQEAMLKAANALQDDIALIEEWRNLIQNQPSKAYNPLVRTHRREGMKEYPVFLDRVREFENEVIHRPESPLGKHYFREEVRKIRKEKQDWLDEARMHAGVFG